MGPTQGVFRNSPLGDNCSRHGKRDSIGWRILIGLSQSWRQKIYKIADIIEQLPQKNWNLDSGAVFFLHPQNSWI